MIKATVTKYLLYTLRSQIGVNPNYHQSFSSLNSIFKFGFPLDFRHAFCIN